MPTKDELSKLKDKCTWELTTTNRISGYVIKGVSNSIFIPYSGRGSETNLLEITSFCWSSETNSEQIQAAYCIFNNGLSSGLRFNGLPIRPVQSSRLSAGCESSGFVLNTKGVLGDGDIGIESFRRVASGDEFELVVGVDGAQFGEDVAEGVILEVFMVEGGSVLDLGEFSADNVEVVRALVDNGKIKFIIRPKNDLGVIGYNHFFFRVMVR